MRCAIVLGVLFLCISDLSVAVGQVDGWLNPITSKARAATPSVEIDKSFFFEVATSKETTAEDWLQNTPIRSLNQGDVGFFGNKAFACPTPKQAYLVRAAYTGPAEFRLVRVGSALSVQSFSLGSAIHVFKSAIVACLDFQPSDVFISISGAM